MKKLFLDHKSLWLSTLLIVLFCWAAFYWVQVDDMSLPPPPPPTAYGAPYFERVRFEELPQPNDQKIFIDPEIEGLNWNRFATPSFSIMAIDSGQGRYLQSNIEKMKEWTLSRWGLQNIPFSAECRVLCVPTRDMMQKLFRLDRSYAEVRRNESGRITLSCLWLVLDGPPAEVIPSALTMICLAEHEQAKGVKFGFWAHRGIALLNGNLPRIRSNLAAMNEPIQQNHRLHFSAAFRVTEDQYKKKPIEDQCLFDREAAMICLLLRKEFGQDNFLAFLSTEGTEGEKSFYRIFGFSSYGEFDATLNRYMLHLSSDIREGQTPDAYLSIENPKGG
jgi:hypothetical protein